MASDVGGEAATMPLTNGVLHPPSDESAAPSTPGKRKRVPTPEGNPTQENNPTTKPSEEDKITFDSSLRYIIQIVAKDDEHLSILKSSIIPSSPSKPRSKRPKLSDEGGASDSVEARVIAGQYVSYQDFLNDVDKASAAVIERRGATDDNDIVSLSKHVAALKDRLQSLVLQALSLGSTQIKTEPTSDETPAKDTIRHDKKILTLYGGNSSNAKHLFSSLQKADDGQSFIDKPATFPEDRLPNGITTTQAVPFNLEMAEKSVRTFGEVFAPRSTLAQLEPPRRGRAWARDPSSTWVDPFDAITNFDAVLGQKHNYSFTKLPSVHWLHYGGISSSPSYWDRREKQQHEYEQEGEAETHISRSLEEDAALLRGAYSSFAPSFDSSHAVAQSDAKNSMWWAKKGSRRFNTILALHKATHPDKEQQTLDELNETTLEDDIKSFIEETSNNKSEELDTKSLEEKDVNEVLQDISELLMTLDSFRKNRNLGTPLQEESRDDDDDVGTPSSPSAAERATYETLKAGLAAIISNLPPYAVSKLSGDQLAQLNISQKILVEMPSYNGTMEEDDYSLLQKRIAATAPAATPARTGSYPASPAFNQRVYSASGRPQQSGPQSYYAGRQSSSTPFTPGAAPQQNYTGLRPQMSPSQRPSNVPAYSPGQYPPRATPNGYGAYSGQSTTSPAPAYQQTPTFAAGRSASPQKPQAYATPQSATRTAYLNPASGNAQRYYSQQAGQSPAAMYANYPSTTQTPTQYSLPPNVAAYGRNTAEQAMAMARHKAQFEVARQASGTPNPPQNIAQSASQDRSESPATKQSTTPTPAAT